MRPFAAIMLSVTSLTLTGCASHHKADERLSFESIKRALAAVATTPVPLPERTPFDADVEGRRTYLDSYQEGYRTGLTGYYITPLFEAAPHHGERVAGYYAGLSVGLQVWSLSNLGSGPHFVDENPAKTR